jgi:hypothetical protein
MELYENGSSAANNNGNNGHHENGSNGHHENDGAAHGGGNGCLKRALMSFCGSSKKWIVLRLKIYFIFILLYKYIIYF